MGGALVAVKNQLETQMDSLDMALPKSSEGFTSAKSICLSVTSEIAKNSQLQRCSTMSLVQAALDAVSLGVRPGGTMGLAYLVPYGQQAQFMLGYKGLMELAIRTGAVKNVSASLYYQKEYDDGLIEIDEGSSPRISHKRILGPERGDVAGAYCVATMPSGPDKITVMHIDQLEAVRSKLKSGNSPVWRNHTDQMYLKTVIRRAAKQWSISPDFAKVIEYENAQEDGFIYDTQAAPKTDIKDSFFASVPQSLSITGAGEES